MKPATALVVACVLVTTAATARVLIDGPPPLDIAPPELVRRIIVKCAFIRAHLNCTVDEGLVEVEPLDGPADPFSIDDRPPADDMVDGLFARPLEAA